MSTARYCPHCGAELDPMARFCGACGQPAAPPSEAAAPPPPVQGPPSVPPPPWEMPAGPAGPPPPSARATPPMGVGPGVPPAPEYTPPKKKSRTGLWIGVGCLAVLVVVGVLVVGGGLWYRLQKEGSTSGATPSGGTTAPTSTVQPSIAKGELLLSDDFSDPNSGWDVYQGGEDVATYYEGGQYHIEVYKVNWVGWGNPNCHFTDFVLEVDATQVAGPDDNDFGVLLRYVDGDNFYRFEISGDGYYSFDLLQDDEWVTLIGWNETPAIRQGNATNRITVVCEGDLFTFYVNGQYLDEYRDSTFSEGDIGLLAGTIDEAPVHIAFDNLAVYALP